MRLGNETNETMNAVIKELSLVNPRFKIIPVIYMDPPKEMIGRVKFHQNSITVGTRNLIVDMYIGNVIYITKITDVEFEEVI